MSKETFDEAIAYVRALDEQDQLALTAADALATAVEGASETIEALEDAVQQEWGTIGADEAQALDALAAALAEYRKIRPVASLEARSGEKGQ